MSKTTQTGPRKEGLTLRRAAPLIAIAIAAVLGYVFLRDYLIFESLRDNREALLTWRDQNYAFAAMCFVALYIAIVALSLPGAGMMTLTAGFMFGILGGMALSVTGASIGAMLIFLAVRVGLGDFLAERMDATGGKIAKVKHALNENEISVMFLLRLLPVVPFFVANVVPALVGQVSQFRPDDRDRHRSGQFRLRLRRQWPQPGLCAGGKPGSGYYFRAAYPAAHSGAGRLGVPACHHTRRAWLPPADRGQLRWRHV